MSAIDYCKKKPLPDNVKEALLDLVDRIDHDYRMLDGTYGNLSPLVANKVKYIHRLMDGGK